MRKNFSINEALSFGFKTVKNNLLFFIGLFVILILIIFLQDFVEKLFSRNLLLYLGFVISFFVLDVIIEMGLLRIMLNFCDGKSGRFSDLFSSSDLFFSYLLGKIAYVLIVLSGLIFLLLSVVLDHIFGSNLLFPLLGILLSIIPGIILGIRLQFFGYFIIDKRLGPTKSLVRSYAATKGLMGDLFFFDFLLLGINILGFLCFGIGLIVTIPITMLALAFVYRKLSSSFPQMGKIAEEPKVLTKETNK